MDPNAAPNPPTTLPQNIWLHGLVMLVLVILVNLAQTVLGICAILQFLWMLLAKVRNVRIAQFGQEVGNCLAITARMVRPRFATDPRVRRRTCGPCQPTFPSFEPLPQIETIRAYGPVWPNKGLLECIDQMNSAQQRS